MFLKVELSKASNEDLVTFPVLCLSMDTKRSCGKRIKCFKVDASDTCDIN